MTNMISPEDEIKLIERDIVFYAECTREAKERIRRLKTLYKLK